MPFIVIGFLGGVLTIASPCILPVVPFVFARSDRPFMTSRLPFLIGLAGTFALVTGIGVAGVTGAAQLSRYGRWVALALFALFGASLSFPMLAARITGPFAWIGNRLLALSDAGGVKHQVFSALLLGAATGMLWAPCAGPILGAILTGAALRGANWQTATGLAAYAAGAAASLAVVSLAQRRVLNRVRRASGAGELIRRAAGLLVMATVATIALGLDRIALAHVPAVPTNAIESKLLAALASNEGSSGTSTATRDALALSSASLPVEGSLPPLDGAGAWLNSPPLTSRDLRGKVVVVGFWTYSCINCLRTLPYLKAWESRYAKDGLVVIGVHTPEFGFEHDVANVKRAAGDLGLRYPIAIDSGYRVWNAFGNQYWPAFYIADAQGRIRYHHFGEGDYGTAEDVIRQLLAQRNSAMPARDHARVEATGAQAAADQDEIGSGETYLGYREATGFASPEAVKRDTAGAYSIPGRLPLNTWAFGGTWMVGEEEAVAGEPHARIAYRFHARDVHLVLAPPANGKPVRFRVEIDGRPPGASHGSDTTADGYGTVDAARLYQLVRQDVRVQDHTFTIQFFDRGVRAYTFTFG
ncbi:cytochrome c biogenesis protein DipZ [Trinickia dinghuensis]|uniref:Cytochrome c biogenesis protein DipZ n=1 Tax=Trinickia dinghuensis TaxID=2291023 RepID=A0A3D8K8I1_9BURK|nr:cytochrome c biogenesis protein DipZ [Trinickia dinghuensis]RDV00952.1 cytochrome c biogenesis protein DipZ [Trinickia dinghuensis]